jgi:hypothetical protein
VGESINNEIKKYPIYVLATTGTLIRCRAIKSVLDYDHSSYHLHHYIPKGAYYRNKQWYADRGIEQELILMPISIHEQVHNQAVKNLTDTEFEQKYKISRWELVFNKKHTKY